MLHQFQRVLPLQRLRVLTGAGLQDQPVERFELRQDELLRAPFAFVLLRLLLDGLLLLPRLVRRQLQQDGGVRLPLPALQFRELRARQLAS